MSKLAADCSLTPLDPRISLNYFPFLNNYYVFVVVAQKHAYCTMNLSHLATAAVVPMINELPCRRAGYNCRRGLHTSSNRVAAVGAGLSPVIACFSRSRRNYWDRRSALEPGRKAGREFDTRSCDS